MSRSPSDQRGTDPSVEMADLGLADASQQENRLVLLLIEDDPIYRQVLEGSLRKQAMAEKLELVIRSHATLASAQQEYDTESIPNVVVSDLNLPDSEGSATYRALAAWDLPLVIITANQDERLAIEALSSGVMEYLYKLPGEHLQVLRQVRRALERHRARTISRAFRRKAAREQRILALGTMAAGIAHEFNNIFAVVRGSLELMARDQSLLPAGQERILRCLSALKRADSITNGILDLSHEQESGKARCRLDEAVRSAVGFLADDIATAEASVVVDIPVGPLWVRGSANQIAQVVTNLCKNALQALAGRKVRSLAVRVFASGAEGHVVVSDTGVGISSEALPRIFEPFFTTKSPLAGPHSSTASTHGAGLGLAVCEAIVKRHGGRIQVISTLNIGTTCTINLPQSEPELATPEVVAPARPVADAANGSTSRILIVDDEAHMRELVCELVSDLGFQTIQAANGQEAQDALLHEAWAAIVLDWHMPVCDGRGFIAQVGAMLAARNIPVLVSTGLRSRVEQELPAIPGLVLHIISKPFDLDHFEKSLRDVIAKAGHGAATQ